MTRGRGVEMIVAPEIVRAEMDYRVERALAGIAVEQARQAGRAHRSWFHRLREHHGEAHNEDHRDEPRTGLNGTPLAA